MSVVVPILTAILGAIGAGGFQIHLNQASRKHEKGSTLVALISEIESVCALVRVQHYSEWAAEMLVEMRNDSELVHNPMVHLGSDYFTVYESTAAKIGCLDPQDSRDIVRFYGLCKIVNDCTDPNGFTYGGKERDLALHNLEVICNSLSELLKLGDKLVQRIDPNDR